MFIVIVACNRRTENAAIRKLRRQQEETIADTIRIRDEVNHVLAFVHSQYL